MNFVSFEFAVFLAVVYALHWSCRHAGTRMLLLTIASYIFYAVWNWRFCFLMLFVTANAFAAGQMLARATRPRRTAVLAASIGIDLAILGCFKYYDFFLSNVAATLADLGVPASLPVMRIILPVGISFYTFHAISYVVDVYRGKVEPEPSVLKIALYISFFPQLIAGPIVRASFIMPQIRRPRSFSPGHDDLVCVHPRPLPARRRNRRGATGAAECRHSGVWRHDPCLLCRDIRHSAALCGLPGHSRTVAPRGPAARATRR